MNYDAIDSLYLACPDVEAACRPYERLGLHSTSQSGARWISIGSSEKQITLQFLGDPISRPLRQGLPGGSGLIGIGLRVDNVARVLAHLASRTHTESPAAEVELSTAWLGLRAQAGTDIVLLQPANSSTPVETHSFPLRRLDHLAIVAPDLQEKTNFWTEILEVPVVGEVVTPIMVIRQFRIGDAIVELLGPASPDSPIHQRTPGLVSMASWEVADLDAAVAQARAAQFTVSDPAAGALPGTRIATIAGPELAGVNMQLLQYL
jgi:catechol 2,3-dioxygenase-like lactoylglutathione lyase family enzyme